MPLINCKLTGYREQHPIGVSNGVHDVQSCCEGDHITNPDDPNYFSPSIKFRYLKLFIKPRDSWVNSETGHTHSYRIAVPPYLYYDPSVDPEDAGPSDIINRELGHLSLAGSYGILANNSETYPTSTNSLLGYQQSQRFKNTHTNVAHGVNGIATFREPTDIFWDHLDPCGGYIYFENSGNVRIWSSESISDCGSEWTFASGPCNDEFDNGGVPTQTSNTQGELIGSEDYADNQIETVWDNFHELIATTNNQVGNYSISDMFQIIYAFNTKGTDPQTKVGVEGNNIVIIAKLNESMVFNSSVFIKMPWDLKAYEITE